MGEFFVRRPIVAMVLSIVIVILGFLALRSVPISQYPDITPPTIKINTSFVGANAVNVEQGVAAVIEQKVNGVEDMIYMKSTNASDGNLSLDVSFKVGTNLDNANMLTQNRVSTGSAIHATLCKAIRDYDKEISDVSPDGDFANFRKSCL